MDRKTKTKCIKDFPCEVCNCKGMLQILTKNYARVRHYVRLENGKPVFQYHRNSIEYINRILESKSRNPDLTNDQHSIDQKVDNSNLNNQNSSGRSPAWLGHQPPTLTTRVQIPATASKRLRLSMCTKNSLFLGFGTANTGRPP